MGVAHFPVWAVHLSDGVLAPAPLAAGFVVTSLLMVLGAWRLRDEEVPRVAVLAAAFFVASLIHVRVPPTSVHLLLNGLVGVILGWRAALAIPIGLLLQAVLIGHGGFTMLGVNSCVMVAPALLAWLAFAGLGRLPWLRRPWFRAALVACCTLVWVLSLIGCLAVFLQYRRHGTIDFEWVRLVTLHPLILADALVIAGVAAWMERELENAPEFPLGLLVGELSVLATTALSCLVLVAGGAADWRPLAFVLFVAHLPIAVIEGIVVGFTVGFLARVKPEMLGWRTEPVLPWRGPATHCQTAEPAIPEEVPCRGDSLS